MNGCWLHNGRAIVLCESPSNGITRVAAMPGIFGLLLCLLCVVHGVEVAKEHASISSAKRAVHRHGRIVVRDFPGDHVPREFLPANRVERVHRLRTLRLVPYAPPAKTPLHERALETLVGLTAADTGLFLASFQAWGVLLLAQLAEEALEPHTLPVSPTASAAGILLLACMLHTMAWARKVQHILRVSQPRLVSEVWLVVCMAGAFLSAACLSARSMLAAHETSLNVHAQADPVSMFMLATVTAIDLVRLAAGLGLQTGAGVY